MILIRSDHQAAFPLRQNGAINASYKRIFPVSFLNLIIEVSAYIGVANHTELVLIVPAASTGVPAPKDITARFLYLQRSSTVDLWVAFGWRLGFLGLLAPPRVIHGISTCLFRMISVNEGYDAGSCAS